VDEVPWIYVRVDIQSCDVVHVANFNFIPLSLVGSLPLLWFGELRSLFMNHLLEEFKVEVYLLITQVIQILSILLYLLLLQYGLKTLNVRIRLTCNNHLDPFSLNDSFVFSLNCVDYTWRNF
jgi:hypothetical protein